MKAIELKMSLDKSISLLNGRELAAVPSASCACRSASGRCALVDTDCDSDTCTRRGADGTPHYIWWVDARKLRASQ